MTDEEVRQLEREREYFDRLMPVIGLACALSAAAGAIMLRVGQWMFHIC